MATTRRSTRRNSPAKQDAVGAVESVHARSTARRRGWSRGATGRRDFGEQSHHRVLSTREAPCARGLAMERADMDSATTSCMSLSRSQKSGREKLPMRSHFILRLSECVGGKQRASVVTPPGLSTFWPVKTRGSARWRSERAARPALRQSRSVSRKSPGGWPWRSAGLWDGPETLRDASEAVYTKEPMVDVGAWDIGGRDS
jgi:hypothetical protein